MILVLKYRKCGPMIYVSHIDLLRHFTRTFRRAGFKIDFSNGFNPHMLINLGTPLPIGISGASEYLTVWTDTPKEEFLERYNRVAPKGLEGLRVFAPASNPNVAGRTVAADYAVKHVGAEKVKREVEGVVNLLSLSMPVTKKGETTMKEIAPLVNGIRVYPDSLNLCLAAGNTTLRPDKFALFLADRYGFEVKITDVWKYEQYVRGANGALMEMDAYLESLEPKAAQEE